jgi:hypothetical protein
MSSIQMPVCTVCKREVIPGIDIFFYSEATKAYVCLACAVSGVYKTRVSSPLTLIRFNEDYIVLNKNAFPTVVPIKPLTGWVPTPIPTLASRPGSPTCVIYANTYATCPPVGSPRAIIPQSTTTTRPISPSKLGSSASPISSLQATYPVTFGIQTAPNRNSSPTRIPLSTPQIVPLRTVMTGMNINGGIKPIPVTTTRPMSPSQVTFNIQPINVKPSSPIRIPSLPTPQLVVSSGLATATNTVAGIRPMPITSTANVSGIKPMSITSLPSRLPHTAIRPGSPIRISIPTQV